MRRVILALASPVFAAMWTSGTSEAVNQEVKMEATPAVATALVRSMYGLPITVTLQQIPELLALADMYEVRHTTVRPCARPRCTTSLTFVRGLSGCLQVSNSLCPNQIF